MEFNEDIVVDDEKKNNNIISDLREWLDDVDLSWNKFVKVIKNKTKNFDSLGKYKISVVSFLSEKSKILSIFLKKKSIIAYNKFKVYKKNSDIDSKIKSMRIYCFLDKYVFSFLKKMYLSIFIFFLFLCIIFLSKVLIEVKVNSWYQKIIEIKNTKSEEKIKDLVRWSINDFRIASALFIPFLLIPSDKLETPKHVIYWWKQLAYTLNNLIKVYNNVNTEIKNSWVWNIELTKILSWSKNEFFSMEDDLNKTLSEYNLITDLKGTTLNDKFELWKKYLNMLDKYLLLIKNNYQTFLNILWDKKEKKYLVVFQNADEIRPTGWFMWSMWIVHLYKWKITKFETSDVYAYEWNLKKADYLKLKSPEWINKITPILWLRDANYSIKYSNSSENIKFFMNKAWYDLDWIVYINNTLVEDFLKLTWNISFTKIWEDIRYNNFSQIMSLLVESKKYKDWTIWTPKQVLFDFIDEFKQRLVKDWKYLSYINIILNDILKREIVVYSFSPKENELLKNLSLNWYIDYSSSLDFAYPVFTSISWNKSDRYINRSYEKKVKEISWCNFDTSLKISLTHNLTLDDEDILKNLINKYQITNKDTMYIQWTWDNWEYVKVLLPKEAIIENNPDYVIEETEKFKYVSFYLKTKRFETSSKTIKYLLSNKNCKKYSFNLYKQSWIRKYDLLFDNTETLIKKKAISEDFSY